jgi:hypothetical protein
VPADFAGAVPVDVAAQSLSALEVCRLFLHAFLVVAVLVKDHVGNLAFFIFDKLQLSVDDFEKEFCLRFGKELDDACAESVAEVRVNNAQSDTEGGTRRNAVVFLNIAISSSLEFYRASSANRVLRDQVLPI